jgi:hypothetical protein
MGHKTIKRVPMDFDWPLNEVWPGYLITGLCGVFDGDCDKCNNFSIIIGERGCGPNLKIDPPEGPGWQLWETTSEGSPISPVFKSPEDLADWCVPNATFFAGITGTKLEWLASFSNLDMASLGVIGPDTGGMTAVAKTDMMKDKT